MSCFLFLFSRAHAFQRIPVELEISPQGTFLVEEIRFQAQEKEDLRLTFPGELKAESLETVKAPEGCLVTWIFGGRGDPEGPVAREINRLEERREGLEREKEVLEFEEKWLKALKPQDLPDGPWQGLSEISKRLRALRDKRAALEREQAKIEARLTELRAKLAFKTTSLFEPVFDCSREPSEYLLRVRYPLPGIEFREERLLFVNPGESQAEIRLGLRLTQRLGRKLPGLSLVYEVYPQTITIQSPPAFFPWYVDEPPVKLLSLASRGPEKTKARVEPTLQGKRYVLRTPELTPGTPRFLLLEKQVFPAELRVEIPVYHSPKAFLALAFTPKTYLPPGRTRIFLSGRELPSRRLPVLNPGRKMEIYLSEDPWVRVEKVILKDYEEKVGVVKRRLRRTLRWRIEILSSHRQGLPAVLYERLPVSRKKEIRISLSADPPWDELSPEGRATWHLKLRPGHPLRVTLEAVIERPAP